MSRRTTLRQVRRIYAQIPDAKCIGLCYVACGPVTMTVAEADEIERVTGRPLAKIPPGSLTCPYLTAENRCSVYDSRPFVCRIWGVEERLRCPHGCGDAVALSREVGEELVRRLETVAGPCIATGTV